MRRLLHLAGSLRLRFTRGRTAATMIMMLASQVPQLDAQGRLVDEGEFRILISGREVGREVFSIRTRGVGQDLRFTAQGTLTAELAAESIQMTTTLATLGPDRSPEGYEVKVSGDRTENITIRRQGTRFVYRISSEAGQESREVRVPPDAVILEPMVSHHFHFVVSRFLQGRPSVSRVDPRTRRPSQVSLEPRDPTTFSMDGRTIPVRRLRVPAEDGFWEVWYDERGRIMRVEHPLAGFRSERISGPPPPG